MSNYKGFPTASSDSRPCVSRSDASRRLFSCRATAVSEVFGAQECGLRDYNRSSCSCSLLRTLMEDARRGSIR
jgi:hypothetical protein